MSTLSTCAGRKSGSLRVYGRPVPARQVLARFGGNGKRPPIPKGYLGDLRRAAIQLHSKEQLSAKKKPAEEEPAAEEKPAAKRPQFEPKVTGYLRFLHESKAVFDCLEEVVAASDDPSLTPFQSTGLERGPRVNKDIEWLTSSYGLAPRILASDGPGSTYAKALREMAAEDVPAFMCHYYNIYFAHTAGGRMIGKMVSDKVLGGHELQFYQYDGDLSEMSEQVKKDIEAVAEAWTEEDRKRSVAQTAAAFQYSGQLLRTIQEAEEDEPAVQDSEMAAA